MEALIDRSFILNLPAVQAVMQLESNLHESRVLLAVAKVLQTLSDARQVWETGSATGLNAWVANSLQAKAILKELDASSDERSAPDADLIFKFVQPEPKAKAGGKSCEARPDSAVKDGREPILPSTSEGSPTGQPLSGARTSDDGDLCADGEASTATPGQHRPAQCRRIPQKIGRGHVTKARELKARLSAARQENERLKARQLCRACLQRPVELTLLPCGHFLLCVECGTARTECPVCRTTILADVRTIVS